jgi:hypothetical protein
LTLSGDSKSVTIAAVNNAPTANPDPDYTTQRNKQLKVAALAGVLSNDTDVDSPKSILRAVLVAQPPSGNVVLETNGSFTYTPKNGFTGTDTFYYKVDDGLWDGDTSVRLSDFSDTVAVTITVTAK